MKKAFFAIALMLSAQQLYANTTVATFNGIKSPTASNSQFSAYYPAYVYIAGNGVRLRTTPTTSTNRNIYTAVNRGTILRCVGVSGNWWQVVWGNRYLWVSKDFALAYNIN